jgi:alpha-ribazole phosphatase/probable phosphoglycerate mutase
MINIIFESHATTFDNEQKIGTGWNDSKLSDLGKLQAKELGERYKNKRFDLVFCSDLTRSIDTAKIAFNDKYEIIIDPRLRECNFGTYNGRPMSMIDSMKEDMISMPYPAGESFNDALARMKSFLSDLLENHDGTNILIIGHRATQYGLDNRVNKEPLSMAVLRPWKWQPGWNYSLQRTDD